MYLRNAFALAPVSFVLLSMGSPAVALAGDSPKEVCLASADQGQSFRDDGKYSSAREQFLTCARDVCPKLVHDQCTEWLHQLDESMPSVVFVLKDDQGADVTAARVLVDGKALASALDGKPVSLDPGAHDIRFERDTPSQNTALHVVLRTGEKNREVTAVFPAAADAPVGTPEPPAVGPTPPAVPPPHDASDGSRSFGTGRNVAALSMGVAGVAGVAIGVVFGLQSQHDESQAATLRNQLTTNRDCPSPTASPTCQQLSDKVDAQNRDAVLSDVFYVAGGVLVAGAVATWLLWPKSDGEAHATAAWMAPVLDPHQAGLRVGGSF